MTAPSIAVLGLGAMGLPMATRLAARFNVSGFDINPERLALGAEDRRPVGEMEVQVRCAGLSGEAEEADDLTGFHASTHFDRRPLFHMLIGREAPATDIDRDIIAAGVGDARPRPARYRGRIGNIVA